MIKKNNILLTVICMIHTYCMHAQVENNTRGLSKQETDSLVIQLGSVLKQHYFDPDKSSALDKLLMKKLKAGAFYNHSEDSLTAKLTLILRKETNDLHFFVGHQRILEPAASAEQSPSQQVNLNGGFTEARLLENNIGYIRWEHCIADDESFKKIISAFNFLSGCDALIIDVSKNPGGDGRAGGFVNQHLYSDAGYQDVLVKKCGGEKEWHQSEVPYNYTDGACFFDTPLFIIVSGNTASAAEYFALIAREMKRATILGKTTAGAGNPCIIVPFGHYILQVPVCEIKTITGKSIEAKGVVPDVEVESDNAVNETIQYIKAQGRK